MGYLGVSITNSGTIAGGGIQAHSLTTLVNTGKVLGRTASNSQVGAVNLMAGGIITNLATGTISAAGGTYGVRIGAGPAPSSTPVISVTAAAVAMRSRLPPARWSAPTAIWSSSIPGAKFQGIVDGGAAADSTLELGSGASTGTLSGFGSEYINFGTLTFAPSARWLFETNTAITSATIDGFVQGDTIDVTGFTAVNTGAVGGGTSVT